MPQVWAVIIGCAIVYIADPTRTTKVLIAAAALICATVFIKK